MANAGEPVDTIMAAWQGFDSGDSANLSPWPVDVSLVAFDSTDIITTMADTRSHLAQRARALGPLTRDWSEIMRWPLAGGGTLLIAAETLHSTDARTDEPMVRHHTIVAAMVADEAGQTRLAHMTEATPAFLPLVIAQYKRASLS